MDIYNCNCFCPNITCTRLTFKLIKYSCSNCGKKLTIIESFSDRVPSKKIKPILSDDIEEEMPPIKRSFTSIF